MIARLVRPSDHVGGRRDQLIHDHGCTLDPNRRCVPWLHAGGANLLLAGRPQVACADGVGQLRLLYLIIAAHNGNDQSPVAIGKEDRLGAGRCRNLELCREFINGRGTWRCDLLERLLWRTRWNLALHSGDLAVCRSAAAIAEHEAIFAKLAEGHELVGKRAAHHANVARHGDRL